MPKVSVIVPVFDPGANIDDCIRSLLGQSMPAGDCELIFVDDGSTDATPARLDELAAQHPHVRVEHIPNSGWPGRPRNVGLEMARGDYVYFVDNDDWLGEEALERQHAMAVLDRADIVIGKVVGHGKRVPRALFRQNVHGVPFESTTLLGLLTPHKLFRRAFLAEHDIRFPEGRRRLEDHVFVVRSYVHAERISVLADYPCYHWVLRDADTNASFRPFEAEAYFGNVREVLDVVERHLEPGPFRDSVLMHWYRGKMLQRVGGDGFLRRDPEYRRELYEAVRRLALERYDESVHERLPLSLRARSQLLRDGRYEALEELAAFESRMRAKVRLRQVQGDGTHLVLRVRARLAPRRLQFVRRGESVLWDAPGALAEALGEQERDATEALAESQVKFYLHEVGADTEHQLPGRTEVRLLPGRRPDRVRPVLEATARITPTTAAGGSPLPAGQWEVRAAVTVAGFAHARRVRRRNAPLILTSIPPGRIVKGQRAPARPSLRRRIAARLPRLRRTRASGGAAARG
ncbi:MAG: glycosyltransferase family 2 protein [Solirubrobacteraceae bacterium]